MITRRFYVWENNCFVEKNEENYKAYTWKYTDGYLFFERYRMGGYDGDSAYQDEGGFVVSFPELPGCITCGETMESAISNAMDAKKTWLESAIETGIEIHEPDNLEEYSLSCQNIRFHILTADCLSEAARHIFCSVPFSFLPCIPNAEKPGVHLRPVILIIRYSYFVIYEVESSMFRIDGLC